MNETGQAEGAKQTLRQAVVVIHGMGEQRPNDILRAFLKAAIGDLETNPEGDPLIVSRPDKVSDKHDSRRYQVLKSDNNTQTEFYEYHWAHLMESNKLSDLRPLVSRLMWHWPWSVPARLQPFWWLIAILAVVSAVIVYAVWNTGEELNPLGILGALGLTGIAVFVIRLVLKGSNSLLTRYFADVARYIDAAPGNQKVRDVIRKGLVELLDELHGSGRYSRIIVAAHSLGSFIAYDAISYLWARKNKLHSTKIPVPDFEELKHLEASGGRLASLQAKLEESSLPFAEIQRQTSDARASFRADQNRLWIEKRLHGNPWLITDLFTFGSPLAHAKVLLSDLRKKQNLCELPTCPPRCEPLSKNKWAGDTWYSWVNTAEHRIIYHAAPFAVVRWTNFWFPSDLFAGAIAPSFGYGVEDVELGQDRWQTKIPVLSHLKYFSYNQEKAVPGYIETIRKALDLKADSWLEETQDAPGPCDSTQDDTGAL